jgi:hypothetical protein
LPKSSTAGAGARPAAPPTGGAVSKKVSAKKDDDTVTAALATKKDDDSASSKSQTVTVAPTGDTGSGTDDDPPKAKKVATKDDDSGGSASAAVAIETPVLTDGSQFSPANRAIDVSLGMSFTLRNLSFNTSSSINAMQAPPSYSSYTVPGAIVDITAFPLAFGHKQRGILANLGAELFYDKVLHINSEELYGTMNQVANLASSEERLGLFAVFRYPLTPALLLGGKLGYISQRFDIAQTLPDMTSTNVPNVAYAVVQPTAFARYAVLAKLSAGVDLSYLVVTSGGTGTADVGGASYYRVTGMSGLEVAASAEYKITDRIFARALARYEGISMSFGDTPKSEVGSANNTQTVSGASDKYVAFTVVGGYLF